MLESSHAQLKVSAAVMRHVSNTESTRPTDRTETHVHYALDIHVYKDWCTHVADRYSRRCWTSFRLLVRRKPTIPAGLATVHLKKKEERKTITPTQFLIYYYYYFAAVLNINDHKSQVKCWRGAKCFGCSAETIEVIKPQILTHTHTHTHPIC